MGSSKPRLCCILRYIAALLVILLLPGCGKTPNSDPFDKISTGPSHKELERAATAAGFICGSQNGQGVTDCPAGKGLNQPFAEIIEGNAQFAKTEYKSKCQDKNPIQYKVWYGDSDWMLWVSEHDVKSKDVKAISKTLGDPRGC